MNKKKILSVILVVLGLVIIFGSIWVHNNNNKEKQIGGEVDENGCLGPAGYIWNESEQACVREWVYEGTDRYQVTNFYSCEKAGYQVMESYPRQCRTPDDRTFVEEIE